MGEHEHSSCWKQKRQKWANHIEIWNESGKSQVRYCRENGLSPKVFYYWKRKYKEKHEAGVKLVPVGMQPIQVHQAGSIATPLVLIVGQYKVEIGTGFDQATLGRVVQVLDRI
jgi:transposase-like protein